MSACDCHRFGWTASTPRLWQPDAFRTSESAHESDDGSSVARELAGRAAVYEEKPFQIPELDSEPEPDVTVCSNPDFESYGTDDTEVLLVVEVSDSALRYDLTMKAMLYADAGIPEYWVVDLVHRELVVFRNPSGWRVRG